MRIFNKAKIAKKYEFDLNEFNQMIEIGVKRYGLEEWAAANALRVMLGAFFNKFEPTTRQERKELRTKQSINYLNFILRVLTQAKQMYVVAADKYQREKMNRLNEK